MQAKTAETKGNINEEQKKANKVRIDMLCATLRAQLVEAGYTDKEATTLAANTVHDQINQMIQLDKDLEGYHKTIELCNTKTSSKNNKFSETNKKD